MARIFLIFINMIIVSEKWKMRKFFTLQEKRVIVDEARKLPGIIKAVARKYGIGASNIRRWKANFHDFDNRYSDVEGLLSDEGRLPLK